MTPFINPDTGRRFSGQEVSYRLLENTDPDAPTLGDVVMTPKGIGVMVGRVRGKRPIVELPGGELIHLAAGDVEVVG